MTIKAKHDKSAKKTTISRTASLYDRPPSIPLSRSSMSMHLSSVPDRFQPHDAWVTPSARRQTIRAFIDGYCAAHDQSAAVVSAFTYGYAVRFQPGMGREFEHFVIETPASQPDETFPIGAWITRFGQAGLPPELHGHMQPLIDEHLMLADIGTLPHEAALIDSTWLRSEDEIAAFNASGRFPGFAPNPRAFLFSVKIDGDFAAAARYGVTTDGDIVIDRVATAEAYRRRGLASQLLSAIAAHARRANARNALLISSHAGEPLYRRAGFANLAPVAVAKIV
ncbi:MULTISPECIES: GNAT family N-acetyltransferase [Paraburkholderia]|uniref:GNAT family N-acetyltransferase n=1 Tax=Paraburkholderia TaxID=1822464 RepID=UPI00225575BE|nr:MULTISPECIES: GNAT family N-acetyltransferase [Paraburkholderia]MCX4164381.1 GNAT family N-acetyltransferase [Paraburkholderia megapolitana]MDN7159874.1 GNAT family N-acetyltransferase [Paraburkholderia sp. CHISQ3]MDQ6496921.1 GNAT family N-acetyltransferase [Paraburkholderia megapolitana]